jgi:uracil-DNA glycosylase family 4
MEEVMAEALNIQQIEALNREIMVCTLCDLSQSRTHAVPGEGSLNTEIMFVGEAPGFNEDKQGRPFVGQAGKFLNELLAEAGLRREDVFITNVVKCRPPNNRDPLPFELHACRPYLERQIALINPRVIVTLGRYSLGTFFPGDMISRVHGMLREKDGRYYYAMYHPAAALHQESLRQTLINDMRKLGRYLQQGLPEPRTAKEDQQEPKNDTKKPEEHPDQLSLF